MHQLTRRGLRLSVATAGVLMLTGLTMYALPDQFSTRIYGSLVGHLALLSPLLVGAGIILLLLARYPASDRVQRIGALAPGAMLLVLAAVEGLSGMRTGAVAYGLLAVAVVVAPWLRVPVGAGLGAYDLFDLTAAAIQIVIGGLMLLAPGLFSAPAFEPLRPAFWLVGSAGLLTGAMLLTACLTTALKSVNLWVVRLPGVILPTALMLTFLHAGAWTGVIIWFVLAMTILVGNLALPHMLGRVIRPPVDPEQTEAMLTSGLERGLEGWLWILSLLIITLAAIGQGIIMSPVRATLFVILLSAYNATAHWLVPHWGESGQRIVAHVVMLTLASALLLGDDGQVARPLLALLVVLPALCARVLSLKAGLWQLGLLLTTVFVVGVEQLRHGTSLSAAVGSTGAELVIIAASAAMALRFVHRQNEAALQLSAARVNLARQVRELALIERIGRSIRGSLELTDTMQATVDELGAALQADRCYIRLTGADDEAAVDLFAQYITPGLTPSDADPRPVGPVTALVARDRVTVAVTDLRTDTRLANPTAMSREAMLATGVVSVLAVPVEAESEFLGVIAFHMFGRVREWTPAEQSFAEAVAGQVAVAILQAKAHATLGNRHVQLQAAHQDLQARDEELIAQQEEMQAQHEELLEQSSALQAERDKLERALDMVRASEEARARLVAVLESTSDFVVVMDQDGQVFYLNHAVRRLFGLEERDTEATLSLRRWYTRDSLRTILRLVIPGLARHGIWSGELTTIGHDGREVPISQVVMAHRGPDGQIAYYSTVARDVSAARRAEESLRQSEVRFRTAFRDAPTGMALVAPDGQIMQVNQALCDMLGYSEAELSSFAIAQISHPDDRDSQVKAAAGIHRGEADSYQLEKRYVHKSGRVVWAFVSVSVVRTDTGEIDYMISHVQDITERKRAEEELVHLANYDPLTDLYNRRRFQEELAHEMLKASRYGTQGALLFLDLDQFKYINDTLGHQAGDALLCSLSHLLRQRLRRTDTVARLGGDEFAILLPQVDAAQARGVAESLIRAMGDHVEVIAGRQFTVTASIGITLFPLQGTTVEEVLANADMAMYQAKEDGRNGYCVYAPDLAKAQQMETKLTWERRIRQALEHDGFVLHLQPILDLRADTVCQYELLLRMRAEDGQLYYPDTFLDVAERFGLIQAIDRWVVHQAIAMIASEQAAGRRICLEVNLSGRAVTDGELLQTIRQELAESRIDPSLLILEITETAAIADKRRAQHFLQSLQAMGCRFALDDFGSGFSSFAYLKHLPVDYLKIDGSFIQRLPSDPVDQRVVKAVVDLARGLGKQTVAEFVEDRETVEILKELGVDYAQGFHIGHPEPASRWLERQP